MEEDTEVEVAEQEEACGEGGSAGLALPLHLLGPLAPHGSREVTLAPYAPGLGRG